MDVDIELYITNQPQNIFRFRYITEFKGGKHGELKGQDGNITVELTGFKGDTSNVTILCTLCQTDVPSDPRYINLHGNCLSNSKNIDELDPIESQLDENCKATFSKMVIVMTKKNEDIQALRKKETKLREYHQTDQIIFNNTYNHKNMRNDVLLRFDAFKKQANGKYELICPPKYSNIIKHEVKPTKLQISYYINTTGNVNGEEEMILLCSELKNDVKYDVRFFKPKGKLDEQNSAANLKSNKKSDIKDENKKMEEELSQVRNYPWVWQENAEILNNNHCLHSLHIKTPKYQYTTIDENVNVYFELINTANNEFSTACHFTYKVTDQLYSAKQAKIRCDNFKEIERIVARIDPNEKKKLETAMGLLELVPIQLLKTDGKSLVSRGITNKRTDKVTDKTDELTSTEISVYLELLKELKIENILHKVIEENDMAKSIKLYETIKKFNLNQFLQHQNDCGNTCLHTACLFDRANLINPLLKLDADPNIQNKKGCTPLHIAVEKNHNDCVSSILSKENYTELSKPLNIDLKNDNGYTALHLAVLSNNFEIFKNILDFGNASVQISIPKNGYNVWHLAVAMNNLEILKYLISKTSVGMLQENNSGLTPIDLAYSHGESGEIIAELLENQL